MRDVLHDAYQFVQNPSLHNHLIQRHPSTEPDSMNSVFSLWVSLAVMLQLQQIAVKNIALATTAWQKIFNILLHTLKDQRVLKKHSLLCPYRRQPLYWISSPVCSRGGLQGICIPPPPSPTLHGSFHVAIHTKNTQLKPCVLCIVWRMTHTLSNFGFQK